MSKLEDLYLGWTELAHGKDCRRPSWTVDVRTLAERRPGRTHECPDVDCGHGTHADVQVVRMVCRSCGVVNVFRGEERSREYTETARYGYGQAPRKVGGLYLYPGAVPDWADVSAGPGDYLVTTAVVDRITVDNLVGSIGSGRGPRGGPIWSAGLHPRFNDRADGGKALTFAVVSGDQKLKSLTAAARWIETGLAAASGSVVDSSARPLQFAFRVTAHHTTLSYGTRVLTTRWNRRAVAEEVARETRFARSFYHGAVTVTVWERGDEQDKSRKPAASGPVPKDAERFEYAHPDGTHSSHTGTVR